MNNMDYNEIITELKSGNMRFASGNPSHPHQSEEHRLEVAKGQHPFAVLVTCSDSRVPPEIIFDQGLGDLFVICSAGHVLDDIGIGSIEYAVKQFGTKLVVVLGHEKCGAVIATLDGEKVPGHICSITEALTPAIQKIKDQPGNILENAVKANVEMVVEQLNSSKPILSELVNNDKLKIIGAVYDLESGVVEFL